MMSATASITPGRGPDAAGTGATLPGAPAADQERGAALERERRDLTFQIRFGDFFRSAEQTLAGTLVSVFRALNSFTAAVLLGRRSRPGRTGAGSRTELSDPYGVRLAQFHSVFLTNEQLEAYVDLTTGVIEGGRHFMV